MIKIKYIFIAISFVALSACINKYKSNAITEVYKQKKQVIKYNSIVEDNLSTINIIDINSQNLYPEYHTHYYNGINIAIEEINNSGGINGIKLKLIKKNDYNSYLQGYLAAENAGKNNNPTIFLGSTNYASALGVSEYAKENNIPYLITGNSSETILLENSTKTAPIIFRVKEGYLVHIKAIVNSIAKSKDVNSVAIFTYANTEGNYLYSTIYTALKQVKPKIKILDDIRISKAIQAEINFKALANTTADTVIIAVDGPDIEALALKLQRYKLLIGKNVYIMFAGEPEWLDNLGKYTPNGWISTGFPWYSIANIDNTQFFKLYFDKYSLRPRYGSYIGYSSIHLLAYALKEANYGTTCVVNSKECRLKLALALNNAKFNSPFLNIAIDNTKSNIGTYIGILQPFNTQLTQGSRRIEKLDIRMFNSIFVNAK